MGERLVSLRPIFQPKAQPQTLDRGEPGALAKDLEAELDLNLDLVLAKGLDKGLVRGLVQTLAETLVRNEDEDELEAQAVRYLKDLRVEVPAD